MIAAPAAVHAASLLVSVAGVRDDSGWLNVCVVGADTGFPNCAATPSAIAQRQRATAGINRFKFDVPPGIIAVSAWHDENGNGKLDTNWLGIPKEGVGVSNNPAPRRGPPRFGEAAFTLQPQGGEITVNLVYP